MWNRTLNSQPWLEQTLAGSQKGQAADVETILDQAASNARSGRYQAALGWLDKLAEYGIAPSPLELDLRAKIYAQLGYYLEAERCWVTAAKAEPSNSLYPLALERIRKKQRSGLGRVAIIGAAMIVVITLLLMAQNRYHSSQMRELAEVRGTIAVVVGTLDTRLSAMAKETTITGRRLDELRAQTTQLSELTDAIQTMGREEQAAQERNLSSLARIEERLEIGKTQFESGVADLIEKIETLRIALGSRPGAVATVTPTNIAPTSSPGFVPPQQDAPAGPGATDDALIQ